MTYLDLPAAGLKIRIHHDAGIAQLVERNLAKVEVASSSLVSRSKILSASTGCSRDAVAPAQRILLARSRMFVLQRMTGEIMHARSRLRMRGLVGALVLSAAAQFGLAQAQAQSQSQSAGQIVAAGCADDVRRFCSDVPSGGGRIMACLKQYKDSLSDKCKQAAAQVSSMASGGAPSSVTTVVGWSWSAPRSRLNSAKTFPVSTMVAQPSKSTATVGRSAA